MNQNLVETIKQALLYCQENTIKQEKLEDFIHHNPLDKLTNIPFEDAVIKASHLNDAEAFSALRKFQEWMKNGEINKDQILNYVREDKKDLCTRVLHVCNHKFYGIELIEFVLFHEEPQISSILEARSKEVRKVEQIFFHWDTIIKELSQNKKLSLFHHDLEHMKFFELDSRIFTEALSESHGLVFRCLSAYFDSGVSRLPLPSRRHSLMQFFMYFHENHLPLSRTWRKSLSKNIQLLCSKKQTVPLEILHHVFVQLGIKESEWGHFLFSIIKRFKGWAGFILKSSKPNFADFCAIIALCELTRVQVKYNFNKSDIKAKGASLPTKIPASKHYEMSIRKGIRFLRSKGIDSTELLSLSDKDLLPILETLVPFHDLYIRTLFQRALDQKSNHDFLEALSWSVKNSKTNERPDKFTAIFCIDEREESFRRILEEIEPLCKTEGLAGHFGLDIEFLGSEKQKWKKLCPAPNEPCLWVTEKYSEKDSKWTFLKRRLIKRSGTRIRNLLKTPFIGPAISFVSSPFVCFILFIRIFFPNLYRITYNIAQALFFKNANETQFLLQLEKTFQKEAKPIEQFDCSFPAEKLASTLRAGGIVEIKTPFLILVSHGSESLNNPYEAAYNCGACSGGKGWPNARLFADLANQLQVRNTIRKLGVNIESQTRVVAAYHNTSSDSVTFFGEVHSKNFQSIKDSFKKASQLNALERLRRFEDESFKKSEMTAQRKTITRSIACNQVRPEYGHATNAYLIIGRRDVSKNLFMDRRTFLCSYHYEHDLKGAELRRTLQTALPVCTGINLEYFFSSVDPKKYGAETKTAHNINGLNGVMNGFMGDLLVGLPVQTTEIHRPLRLKILVEAPKEIVTEVLSSLPEIQNQISNEWFFLNVLDPVKNRIFTWRKGDFQEWNDTKIPLAKYSSSQLYTLGKTGSLSFAQRDTKRKN